MLYYDVLCRRQDGEAVRTGAPQEIHSQTEQGATATKAQNITLP